MDDLSISLKKSPFHSGEKLAQEKLGVAEQMEKFGAQVIRSYLPDQHREFFNQLPVLFAGHVDGQGWPWATILSGHPGFASSPDPTSLGIAAMPVVGDPLEGDLDVGKKVGLLGLELQTRRRNRLNATVNEVSKSGFQLSVDQSFGNCPQYIQTRNFEFIREPGTEGAEQKREDFSKLDEDASVLISAADTFFVASFADVGDDEAATGADMSHRGGRPGFVKIEGDTLIIPDYVGNFHFNTIGNFLLNPKAGLLFVDFEKGDMLQLTGTVEVLWDASGFEFFEGAERAWRFTLDHGIWLRDALPLRWEFGEMSLNSLLTGSWSDAAVKEKAEGQRTKWRDFQVIDIVQESKSIKSFYLQPDDDAGLLSFEAGQYLTVQVKPGSNDKHRIRTYTLSSAPLDKAYRISVKKEGQVSGYLHDKIKVGDVVQARAPKGKFTFDTLEKRPAMLLAGGVGITPMISMMRHALQDGFRTRSLRPVTLIYSAQNSAERAFHQEAVDMVNQAGQGLRYISLLGKIKEDEAAGVDYHGTGYITQDLLQDVLPDGDCEYFLCGSAKFMQSNYDLLRQMGVQDKRIFAESFGPASLIRKSDTGEATTLPPVATEALVTFAKSGVEQIWREEEGSLLEFAENHGLTPEYGCRNGACGNCIVDVADGAVTYTATPSAGLQEGKALLCCAHPAEGVENLVLDL